MRYRWLPTNRVITVCSPSHDFVTFAPRSKVELAMGRLKISAVRKVAVALCGISCSAPAFAYLDPGTGSILLQGVLGALAAIGIALKIYWHRFLKLIGVRKSVDYAAHTDRHSAPVANRDATRDNAPESDATHS
jgi:hypothetical protein